MEKQIQAAQDAAIAGIREEAAKLREIAASLQWQAELLRNRQYQNGE